MAQARCGTSGAAGHRSCGPNHLSDTSSICRLACSCCGGHALRVRVGPLTGAFGWWGRAVYRLRWPVVLTWLVLLALAVPLLPKLPERLRAGGFSDDTLPSSRAQATLQRELGIPENGVAVFYVSDSASIRRPRNSERSRRLDRAAARGSRRGRCRSAGPERRQIGRSGKVPSTPSSALPERVKTRSVYCPSCRPRATCHRPREAAPSKWWWRAVHPFIAICKMPPSATCAAQN